MAVCVRKFVCVCVCVGVVFILACLAHFLLSSGSAKLQSAFWVVAAIAASAPAPAIVIEAQL